MLRIELAQARKYSPDIPTYLYTKIRQTSFPWWNQLTIAVRYIHNRIEVRPLQKFTFNRNWIWPQGEFGTSAERPSRFKVVKPIPIPPLSGGQSIEEDNVF